MKNKITQAQLTKILNQKTSERVEELREKSLSLDNEISELEEQISFKKKLKKNLESQIYNMLTSRLQANS